jgi:hypothetical protein
MAGPSEANDTTVFIPMRAVDVTSPFDSII